MRYLAWLSQSSISELGRVVSCLNPRRSLTSGNRGGMKGHRVGILENDTHDSALFYVFIFFLTSIFIHSKNLTTNPLSPSPSRLLSPSLCVSLFLSCPPYFFHLSLSAPHCQCREHSRSHRPLRGNTQQTRKMTASAISFSEGLQVRQEMAIIPSTLSVLSYFLL